VKETLSGKSIRYLRATDTIRDVLNHPAFAGFARLLFPWDDRAYDEDLRLSDIGSLLPYHSHVDPEVQVLVMGSGSASERPPRGGSPMPFDSGKGTRGASGDLSYRRRCSNSTSALSQFVRQLEARLGVTLLTRTSRTVGLTDAGQRLLENAGPAVEQALESSVPFAPTRACRDACDFHPIQGAGTASPLTHPCECVDVGHRRSPSHVSLQETFMQAIVQDAYGAADVLHLREIARPTVGADEVLIRVHAAGVDFGVWHLMTGLPYAVRLVMGVRKPRNPVRGLEVAGVVEAAGVNVTAFKPGDEVFGVGEGSFAEYARASQTKVLHKPSNLTFEQAAVVPISATTALMGLRAAKVEPGQNVLVIGAGGGVGSYAVQLARSLGAEVTGVCATAKLEFVHSIGATHTIDYTREDFADGTRKYDVIIDLAGSRSVSHLRRALTPTGTLVILGGEGGGRWLGMGRQAWSHIVGLFSRQKFRSPIGLVNQDDLGALKALIEAGKVTPIIDRSYPLSEVAAAVRVLAEGHSRGKSVIKVR